MLPSLSASLKHLNLLLTGAHFADGFNNYLCSCVKKSMQKAKLCYVWSTENKKQFYIFLSPLLYLEVKLIIKKRTGKKNNMNLCIAKRKCGFLGNRAWRNRINRAQAEDNVKRHWFLNRFPAAQSSWDKCSCSFVSQLWLR